MHPSLLSTEKQIVLSSWAFDARAVALCPTQRCLPGEQAKPVPLDAILAALQALDEGLIDRPAATGEPRLPFAFGRGGNCQAASWQNGLN